MVKRCQWGLCNSDSRYHDRLEGGIEFIPFPKPKRDLDKCKRWIKACGRPHSQLNTNVINYHMFVCTKHFVEGKPTNAYPDPLPAEPAHLQSCRKATPARRPLKRLPLSEPPAPKRRRNILQELTTSANEENVDLTTTAVDSETQTETVPEPEISPLDMLALAAENSALQRKLEATQTALHKQLAQQVLQNESLKRANISLQEQAKSKPAQTKPMFSVEMLQKSPVRNSFRYYTGFVYVQFMCIFNFLVPDKLSCPIKFTRTVTSVAGMKLEDQLLLTMIKLRLNLQFKHIATLFKVSSQDAGALFRQWINYMFYRFGAVSIWPDRDVIISNMPKKYKEDFPDTLLIIDGTELKVQRPSSLRSQSQCYSDYKSATTLKALVGVDPRGSFTFISMLFSGSISDKEITTQSGLIEMLQQLLDCGKINKGDGIMVDKGFLIKDEVEKLGLRLYIPPFASASGQMPAGDVSLTRKIARHRVHVERAISRAKKFKIVDNRIDLSLFPSINQIWFCCCFLTGFMPLLIQDKD